MPKFVPRQRKHKVLARNKRSSAQPVVDSNVIEHIPIPKSEIEEKKQRLREELQKDGLKISGKKAKRLEKYISTKIRKDENRELIQRLGQTKTDTSLFQSSKKLGQGKETKREKLHRALRDRQAGIDVDGDNEEILFWERTAQEVEELSEEEDEKVGGVRLSQNTASAPIQPAQIQSNTGSGLKRPLEVDDEGKPVLKKRKRRGGVTSKLSFKHEATKATEVEWEGFSSISEDSDSSSQLDVMSDSNDSPDDDEGIEESVNHPNGTNASEDSLDEDVSVKESDRANNSNELSDSDGSMEEDDSGDDPDHMSDSNDSGDSQKRQRSSAFKAWATQKINEVYGYEPTSNIPIATETQKIEGFEPRAPEQDPLPLELQPTPDVNHRKAFSVPVTRPPDIQDARLKLPVVAEEQKIMEAIHNNHVVVVWGATGSGKTTQVPQFLFEAGYGSPDSPNPGMIGITQPRRVAAVSMAKRVGDELGDHGKKVAYQIRFEGTVGPQTAVKFMTDGVLLREVAEDISLEKYSAIIIDEAHERTVNTDILIGMLSRVANLRAKKALEDPSKKPLKLVIMSATIRITDFTQNELLFPIPPPVIEAEGRQYEVTTHYARKTHHDYVEEAFRKVSKGHRKLPPGAFLVFLTGQNEIAHLSKRLKEAFRGTNVSAGPQGRLSAKDAPVEAEDIDFGDNIQHNYLDSDEDSIDFGDDEDFVVDEEADTGPAKMHVLPLYSLLPTREQLRVFEPPPDGSRLVVLATNVAETSLTIPGIRYVFDCGRSKERKYDEVTGVQSFEVGWISKASAKQRAGRAGRTGPGHCYKLYSSAVYERDFEEFAKPEILRMPIEGVVLQLKAMNLQHVVNFPFPTPPDRQNLARAEKLLTYLSAITQNGQITKFGSMMSIFPLSPRFSRILLIGHQHDCLPYTIALVAGMSAGEVFISENQAVPAMVPREEDAHLTSADRMEEEVRNNVRRRFNKVQKDFCYLDDRSDAMKLLQVVLEYSQDPNEAWCREHFVHFKVLNEIQQLRRQITDLVSNNIATFADLKFQAQLPPPKARQVGFLKQMVAAGFLDHVALRADLSPNPPELTGRTPKRAIDVPYLTLFPSSIRRVRDEEETDRAVYIHPASPLAHLPVVECPQYIIYSHLQRTAPSTEGHKSKTRMHALTDITGNQLAALTRDTPLLYYGKPIGKVPLGGKVREVTVIPFLRAEGSVGTGWPLPARKVTQEKDSAGSWVVK